MKYIKFGIWMAFALTWACVMLVTVIAVCAMMVAGLWNPSIPMLYKCFTPFGFVLIAAEAAIALAVLEWSTE